MHATRPFHAIRPFHATRSFKVPLFVILGLLVLVSMLVSVPAFPATFTVDPAGDDANAGDSTAPWRTVQHAASTVTAGDRIEIRAGNYVESVSLNRSGTADRPIVFAADPGAILMSPDPHASMEAFDIAAGTGYLTLIGIEATGGFAETIFLRAGTHDIRIEGCMLHDNHAGIIMGGASNITVEHCSIHHNGTLGIRIAGGSHDVTINDTDSFMNANGMGCSSTIDGFAAEADTTAITFNRARAYGNGGDGFDLQGDQVTLNDVESFDNACTGIKLDQNAVIRGCLVVANNRGVAVSSVSGGSMVDMAQCTVAANHGVALDLRNPLAPNRTYGVHVRNSILTGDFKAIQYVRGAMLSEAHNIFFRPSPYDPVIAPVSGHGTTGHDINIGRWARRANLGDGTLAVDPLFVDAVNGDFRVDSTSPVVGRGAPLDGATTLPNIGLYQVPSGPTNHSPWADAGRNRIGRVNRKLRFDATGSVDPDRAALSYRWDFGDGSNAVAGFRVTHAFSAPGMYAVTLTVSDGALSGQITIQTTIL